MIILCNLFLIGSFINYITYMYILFGFRTDEDLSERKRKKIENDQPLEELYENNVSKIVEETGGKSVRMLLPIKTHDGVLEKRIIEEDSKISDEEDNKDRNDTNNEEENKEDNRQESSDMEVDTDTHVRFKLYSPAFLRNLTLSIGNFQNNLQVTSKPVSTIELMACHEEMLKAKRFKIGILSSGILENPELKSENFNVLLKMMDEQTEVYITIRKLAMVSLLEIFKDLLPSYNILQVSQKGLKRMYTY